jgi:hypothetical protein
MDAAAPPATSRIKRRALLLIVFRDTPWERAVFFSIEPSERDLFGFTHTKKSTAIPHR